MSAPIQQLIYFSLWKPQNTQEMDVAVGDILAEAEMVNSRSQVTGALLCCNGWFLQVLEGSEASVSDIYARIARDRRHHSVTLIDRRRVERRAFPGWSMCAARLDPIDDAIIGVLGRQSAFSPPELSFEAALQLLAVVQQVQQRQRATAVVLKPRSGAAL